MTLPCDTLGVAKVWNRLQVTYVTVPINIYPMFRAIYIYIHKALLHQLNQILSVFPLIKRRYIWRERVEAVVFPLSIQQALHEIMLIRNEREFIPQIVNKQDNFRRKQYLQA